MGLKQIGNSASSTDVDQPEPLRSDPTVLFEFARPFESARARGGSGCWPSIMGWTLHSKPRCANAGAVRPTTESFSREFARRVAGEGRRGDAGKWPKWVRNTIAHPNMAGNSPEVDWSGGATRRSGGELTVKTAMAGWQRPPRLSARISTRGALGTYWDDPEPRRLPEASRRW